MKRAIALLTALLLTGFALTGCFEFTPLVGGPARTAGVTLPASPEQTPEPAFPDSGAEKPADAAPYSEELARKEGDDGNYLYTDQAKFCGYWHASASVGSGYSARYLLDVDGTFIYGCDEMDGLDRMRYASGNWYIDGNKLCLEIWERIVWEGGREVAANGSTGTGREIVDPKIRHVDYGEAELEAHVIAEAEPDAETGKSVIMIDCVAFYSFEEQSDLLSGFWEMKELAE